MPERPNLLVIMSDQHSPDVLGASGNERVHTPHLDRLAADGTLFRNAYCNSPICVPSRMSFLSGMTPGAIEVWSLSDAMRSDLATWPVVLGAAGYDTAMSGRMHMWWPDKGLGFHRRLCGDPHTRLSVGTFELYEDGPEREQQCEAFRRIFYQELRKGANGPGPGPQRGFPEDKEATDKALAYIRSRQGAENPYALCVGFFCPHTPYRAPQEYYERYEDMPVAPTSLDENLPDFIKDFARRAGADEGFDPELQAKAVRAYYAMVTYVDEQVGRLVAALEETGQLEDTAVIYTADHGDMLGRRGLWFKNQLLDPCIRTPLIARFPARFRRGEAEDCPASLLDLYPTFAELGCAEPWPEIQGDSLVPLLSGQGAGPLRDRSVFVEYADFGIGQPAACVRRGDLKLISVRNYESVMYDLAKDPGETNDVYRDPAYTEDARRLEAELAKWWDAEDTWRRVVRNQNRVHLIRKSRLQAIERNGGAEGLLFDP